VNIGFIARIASDIQQMKRDTGNDSLNSVRAKVPTKESAIAAGHPENGHQIPGCPPYTRGIHESMYSSKLWTMRQYSGFSSTKESNKRYHYLLEQGVKGLSIAFDLPTQTGYDSDHELSIGEVGKAGVPISTIEDMRILLKDIPLDQVSISMTINSTAIILLGFLIVVAEENNIKMAIHPDDPPIPLFGVPRIVSTYEDYKFILNSYNSKSNGMTFCSGSLASNAHNDIYKIFNKFKDDKFIKNNNKGYYI